MAENELQEKMLTYRLLEFRLDGFMKQREIILNKIAEMQSTLSTINEVSEKSNDILIPIGSEAYSHGKLMEKKTFIVEIGAGVALEKDTEDAKEVLNKRLDELGTAAKDLQKETEKISTMMQQLAFEIQSNSEQPKAG